MKESFKQQFVNYVDYWKNEASTSLKIFIAVLLTMSLSAPLGPLIIIFISWVLVQLEMESIKEKRSREVFWTAEKSKATECSPSKDD